MLGEFLVHFPYVAISDESVLSLDHATFRHIPVREWQDLDDEYEFLGKDYEEVRPVFCCISGQIDEPSQGVPFPTSQELRTLWYSMLLTELATPSIDPMRSVAYFRRVGSSSANVVFRSLYNRWLLTASNKPPHEGTSSTALQKVPTRGWETMFILDLALQSVQRNYTLLKATRDRWEIDEVVPLLELLGEISGPELILDETVGGHSVALVSAVSRAEDLFSPRGENLTLTEAFGVGTGPLFLSNLPLDETRRALSKLYVLRSQLIHGEIWDPPFDFSEVAREFLRHMILRMLLLRGTGVFSSNDGIPGRLGDRDLGADSALEIWGRHLSDGEKARCNRLLSALGSLFR